MTEADARALLRDCGGFGGLEAWIAGRRWKTAPGGWTVTGELQGWQFRLDVISAGLRISASAPGRGDDDLHPAHHVDMSTPPDQPPFPPPPTMARGSG
jgi:hypothetical protein